MKTYVIVDINIEEPEAFMRYRERIGDLISKYGGRYVVRGGEVAVLLANSDVPQRVVVLEFPSRERANGFFDERATSGLKELFEKSTRSRILVVDGYEDSDEQST